MSSVGYAEISHVIRADFASGKLYWLPRTPDMFASFGDDASEQCSLWNAEFAGQEALVVRQAKGYLWGRLFGESLLAHRVIWLLATGAWPEDQIDHINGQRDDNRLCNLRAVTSSENSKNQAKYINNKSGVTGVLWHKGKRKWRAQIRSGGRETHLGYYEDFDDAVLAREAANKRFGFHPNHGRCAA